MKLINGILKWLAAILFSLAAGLLVIILLSNKPEITALMLRLIMLAAISFVGSLLLRLFFRRGIAFLLILLAIVSTTFSTLVIDYFYETEFTLSFLSKEFVFQVPTTQDIAQLVILFLISLPALLLFKKKRVKKQQVVEPKKTEAPNAKGPSLNDRIKIAAHQINPKNWNLHLPKFGEATKKPSTSSPKPSARPKVHVAGSKKTNGSKPRVQSTTPKSASVKKIKLPKFNTKPVENGVNLKGEEDHVCPYCLEEVLKNDSRGIAVCKECGTWHHQDCWDVTGACGVAHRNKL